MNEIEIKIFYQHTEAEYLAANRLYLFSTPRVAMRLIVFFLLLVFAVIMTSIVVTDGFPILVMLLFVLLLEAALIHNILVRIPRQYFRGDPKFRVPYEVTFSDDGIAVKTPHIDSKISWTFYSRVLEGRDIYLLIYGNETRMMTMVPKRAFTSVDQETQFRKMVGRHITDQSGMKQISQEQTEYRPTSLTPPDWR